VFVKTSESEYKTKSAIGIGHFLTQKVVRPEKFRKLIAHQVHGATYTTLKGNEVSNRNLTDIYSHKSDAYFRFMVVGRADCLPTVANLQRWYPTGGPQRQAPIAEAAHEDPRIPPCRRCTQPLRQTLAHALNKCTPNFPLMTDRHNRVVKVVRDAVIKFSGESLQSNIDENQPIPQEGLSEGVKMQRPDMFFLRNTRQGQILEILEFSCPYGYICDDRDTLEKVYGEKMKKYEGLANELKLLRHHEVNVTAIIVSSMGAVYGPSLQELRRILGCNDREIRKLGKQMSDAALTGSMKIWRTEVQNREQRVTYGNEGDALVEQEAEIVNIPEEAEDEKKEEEEDEMEQEGKRDRRGERRDRDEVMEHDDQEVRRAGHNERIERSDHPDTSEGRDQEMNGRPDQDVATTDHPADDEDVDDWLSSE
jgi:hypothetical protein